MDYSAKCPVCGDSKSKKLKRCHLFTKASWDHDKVHCFNCGWKGNMFSLLELISPSLYNSYKNEKRSDSFNALSNSHKEVKSIEDDIVINLDCFDSLRARPPKLFDLPSEFKDIEVGDDFYNYLKSRKMTDEIIQLFKKCNSSITYNGQLVELNNYIILPLWCDKQVYGFQARHISHKQFYTFIPEENSGYKVWNWFDVYIDEDLYIFESYFDALSSGLPLKNIVAQLGATLSVERLKESKKPIFVLDNQRIDPTARVESLKYIRMGYKVMVWPNKNIKYKDFNDILKNGGNLEKISNFIKSNIDDGITAEISLMM